jgi:LPXTG-site transpeptidase (sortase) family protein
LRRAGVRPVLAVVLLTGGAIALGTALAGYLEGRAWQSRHALPVPAAAATAESIDVFAPGEPIARLRIPRIELDLTVIEGTRRKDLRRAPGRLEGTGLPGGEGNCVIAGHRDIHFRNLGDLRKGDLLEVEFRGRRLEYRVRDRQVVDPSRTDLLRASDEPTLTLVTCYPFYFVGPAPKRFVVRAVLQPETVSANPGPAPVTSAEGDREGA